MSARSLLCTYPTVAFFVGLVASARRLELLWSSTADDAAHLAQAPTGSAARLAMAGQFAAALGLAMVAVETLRAVVGRPALGPPIHWLWNGGAALGVLAVVLMSLGGHKARPLSAWAKRAAFGAVLAAGVAFIGALLDLAIAFAPSAWVAFDLGNLAYVTGIPLALALLCGSRAKVWRRPTAQGLASGAVACGLAAAVLQVPVVIDYANTLTLGEIEVPLSNFAAGLSGQLLVATVALFVAATASQLGRSVTFVSGLAVAAVTASGLVPMLIGDALAVEARHGAMAEVASGAIVLLAVCGSLGLARREEAGA